MHGGIDDCEIETVIPRQSPMTSDVRQAYRPSCDHTGGIRRTSFCARGIHSQLDRSSSSIRDFDFPSVSLVIPDFHVGPGGIKKFRRR